MWFKSTRYKSNNFATMFAEVAKDKVIPTPSWAPIAKDESCLYSNNQSWGTSLPPPPHQET